MPFEVYTGVQPGRPRLLAVLTASFLAAALGLAWWQVQQSRALGVEHSIGELPLHVRLPKAWRPDPKNAQRFLLPVGDADRQSTFEFERRVQFDLFRLPNFEPLEMLLRSPELGGLGETVSVAPTRIGPYAAVELHQFVPLRLRRGILRREIITRLACLPRGHVLKVVYEPLTDLRPADRELLDEVCNTLRVDDATLNGAAADYLHRAGLTLTLDPTIQVVGTDFAEVPGVFLGGVVEGQPAWAIGVLRTWLAAGRSPADLLVDLAAQQWLLWDSQRLHVETSRRADGATIASVRHPTFGEGGPALTAARVVAQSPQQAVVLLVFAGSGEAEAADRQAEQIAGAIQIATLGDWPALADAEATGERLARDLQQAGAAPRWGRERTQTTYRKLGNDEMVVTERGAIQNDPSLGYEGSMWRRVGRAREERIVWTIDGHAQAYRWEQSFFRGSSALQSIELRGEEGADVIRQMFVDERREQRWKITPTATFIPPPAESIIKGWIARGDMGAAIVSVASLAGPNMHTVLLRPLPAQSSHPRVLVQQDFWPLGGIEEYDDARGETYQETYPNATYRRVK
jgi:hypothetical protein